MASLGCPVRWGLRDFRVLLGLLDLKDLAASLVLMDKMVLTESLGRRVLQVRLERLELQGQWGLRGLLGLMELMALTEKTVCRVRLGRLERMALRTLLTCNTLQPRALARGQSRYRSLRSL